jgi:hypothetical protein
MADEVFLVPAQGLVPMRCPDGFAAILVTCVDVADGSDLDHDGDAEFLTGHWMSVIPQPERGNDGDVILVLHNPNGSPSTEGGDARVDIEMRLLNGRRWQRVGVWPAQDNCWPHVVAPTASAIMGLHTDILELEDPPQRIRSASGQAPVDQIAPQR